jgi:hypothetical protein
VAGLALGITGAFVVSLMGSKGKPKDDDNFEKTHE